MKSKAPLVMMEQIVMVLIFALAAALCLQTFALSGKLSKQTEAKNRAMVEAQNVAETMKDGGTKAYINLYHAVQKENTWVTWFDADWNATGDDEQAAYCLAVCPEETETPYLWRAAIVVTAEDGEELARLIAAGQKEVVQNE